MKKGCAECRRIGSLCGPHRTKFLRWNARALRSMLPKAVADVALGLVCDCGALKSNANSVRCSSCSQLVPRVHRPRPLCACGGPASSRWDKCLSCKKGVPRNHAQLACGRRRRERIASVGGRYEAGRWRRICARDSWICWICGEGIDPALVAPHRFSGTADHIIAVADLGSDGDDNLRAAHFRCNSKRGRGRQTEGAC